MKHSVKSSDREKRMGRPALSPVINEMKICFPAFSVNEGFARTAAGAFIAGLDPTISELSDIKCAISEAVTNCIVHAYRDYTNAKCPIHMTIKLREDRTVIIEIKDSGCGIPDIKKAREPLYTTDAAGERSGMGFTVMESFTDKVTVASRPGRGTVVHLIKKLSPHRPF